MTIERLGPLYRITIGEAPAPVTPAGLTAAINRLAFDMALIDRAIGSDATPYQDDIHHAE